MADPRPLARATSPAAHPSPRPKKKKEPHVYPAPFVVSPISQHTHTILLLHGRGSTGEAFGREFLLSPTSAASGPSLRAHFPGTKFIFPTAKKRRARSYNRALISQWFDNVPINSQDGMSREEAEWQLDGLAETARFLGALLDEEVRAVGARNVVLGGLSQGCAMGLHVLLSYQPPAEGGGGRGGGALGGFVGMSGWLPFAGDVRDLLLAGAGGGKGSGGEDGDEDPFAASDEEDGGGFGPESAQSSLANQVCDFVRENLEMPPLEATEQPPCLETPVFLGHGKSDEKVKVELGLEAAEILREMGMRVRWEEYDVGHWYKVPEEIDDIVDFLKTVAG